MAVTIQQGKSFTMKLKFLNSDGSVAPAPSSGGSVSTDVFGLTVVAGTATLAADQETVTYVANGNSLGTDTLSYGGPEGLTASENVIVVATTAVSVTFDESTFTLITG